METTYGALQIPVQLPATGEEISDPAISLIANYCKALLNTYAQAAWSTVAPTVKGLTTAPNGLASPVVRAAFGHNPEEESFTEDALPALYLWRAKGAPAYYLAEDYRVSDETWTLLWLFRPAQQDARRIRQSFVNAVYKIIDDGIERQRDPVYVAATDTDPTAATTPAAPTTIKTAITSSTSAQTYSGAALNGAIGGTVFAPPQLPTVTVTGASCSGTVEFTGLGGDGAERVSRVDLAGTGTFAGDWDLTQITSIYVPAQAGTAATLTFGLAPDADLRATDLALDTAGAWLLHRQRGHAAPVLPVDLMRRPLFRLSVFTSFSSFTTQGLAFVALPFFFQQQLGRPPVETGMLMSVWALVVALMAPVAGTLSDRYPPAILGGVGLGLLSLGMAGLGEGPGFVAPDGSRVPDGQVDTYDDALWDRSIAINLTGSYNTMRNAARLMKAGGKGGSIIATASNAGPPRIEPGPHLPLPRPARRPQEKAPRCGAFSWRRGL